MDRGDLVAERGSRKIQDLLVEDRQREKGERQGDEESRQENRRPGKGEICMRLDVKEGKKTCLDWLDRELERMCSRFFGR